FLRSIHGCILCRTAFGVKRMRRGESEVRESQAATVSSSHIERSNEVTMRLTPDKSAYERSRWRGGRCACYAPPVMPQGSAFNFDFRFPLIFLSHAQSIGCKRKKIQFPAVSSTPAISPHPPQPPTATFKRLYRTCVEQLGEHRDFVSFPLRCSSSLPL